MMNFTRSRLLRPGDVHLYTVCDQATAGLVCLMAVFSPWAFGTTQAWSMWTMNIAGYCLGILLAIKLTIRWLKGYLPPRWDLGTTNRGAVLLSAANLNKILAGLIIAILVYCLTSAINAAATYKPEALSFVYHPHAKWLPHSFDSRRTWLAFWNYLGLACAFWAIKDWLPGKSGGEERATRQKSIGSSSWAPLFPARLRRLLWLLSINGALLGLEGIVQRLEGSGRLLFLIKPVINTEAVNQFGPYHYRANASAYFNLVWPVCLGFWWMLHRSANSRDKGHHVLLACGIIMAACPIISSSRGGALVTIVTIFLAAFFLVATHFLLIAHRKEDPRKRRITLLILMCVFAGALMLGFGLGWKALKPRMAQFREGYEGREEMFESARPMAKDYPVFGTGPGTFETVFQLYRISTETYWPAQLHNDWLETLITFGWVGSMLIAAVFVTILLRWFARGGLHGGRRFMILIWLALGGCLLHARFDFPFQIYSIVFLFLMLCALVFNLSRRPG